MSSMQFIQVANELETFGLVWQPEIGDEIAPRGAQNVVSILVDPQGMTPRELRTKYLWLPNVEQMVEQIEVRQGILYHAGLEITGSQLFYKTVIRAQVGLIESQAENFRVSLGLALKNLLAGKEDQPLH
jgi:hypothetical protein